MSRPIAESLFTEDAEGRRLIGATCTSCGAVAFPNPRGCPRCASEEMAQLRGTAGDRQIPGNPRVGFGQVHGVPGTAATVILSR